MPRPVVVPSFWDRFQAQGDWQRPAWWVHDHLPYPEMFVFPTYWAFNLSWREDLVRRIDIYAPPKDCHTKLGMLDHAGSDQELWLGLPA